MVRKVEKVEKGVEKEADGFEIVPAEDISKMTIEEAIDKGLLPTPIELAKSPGEVIEYGRQAGTLYGSAIASLYSAFTRKDLPFNVRLAKGTRGVTFLLGLLISAVDSFEKIRGLEEHVLAKKGKLPKSEQEKLIDELLDELERLRKENEELKREGKKGEVRDNR